MKKHTKDDIKFLLNAYTLSEVEISSILKLMDYGLDSYDALKKVKTHVPEELHQMAEGILLHNPTTPGNYAAAKTRAGGDFEDIWNFFQDPLNRRPEGYTSKELAALLDKNYETVKSRISDLKACGLFKVMGYKTYDDKNGNPIRNNSYNPVCYDKFNDIKNRLKFIPKTKQLKQNTVLKEAINLLINKVLDRGIEDEVRNRYIGAFLHAMNQIVEKNPQVKNDKDRFRLVAGTYDGVGEFINLYKDVIEKVEWEQLNEDKFDSSETYENHKKGEHW